MKFCEECGAQLEDDAIFCEECGTSVENLEIVPDIPPAQPQNISAVKEKKVLPKKFIAIGVAILLIVIIGSVITGVLITKKKNNNISDDGTEVVDATIETTESEDVTIESTEREETTTIIEETEEVTTENVKVEPVDKVEVFTNHPINQSASWYYRGEYEGGLVIDINDTSMVYVKHFYNCDNNYGFSLGGYDNLEYGIEYDFTDDVYDDSYEYETYKLVMTIYEDGIDIYWAVKEDSWLIEVYNGFYEMIDVQASCGNTKYTDALNIEQIQNIYDFESDCFYKNLFGGALRSVSYWVQEYSSFPYFSVSKDFVEDSQYMSIRYGEGITDFPISTELYYNEEAVFYYEFESSTMSYVELDYSIDKNGQRVYDLSGHDYYEEVRITFTEEHIYLYWSSHSYGDESVIYDEIIPESEIYKNAYISNFRR